MAAKRSLGSEWFGFDGDEFIPPKSFGNEGDSEWSMAYRAIFYLVGGLEESPNVDVTNLANVSRNSKTFLEYVLLRSVVSAARKLSKRYRPTYTKRTEVLSQIRGRIEFGRSATESGGDKSRMACSYYELAQADPVVLIIQAGSSLVRRKVSKWLNETNQRTLARSSKRIDQIVQRPNKDFDLIRASHILLASRGVNGKFDDLFTEARILAYFILASRIGFSRNSKSGLAVDGVMLNLNRVFERLLCDSLEATGTFERDRESVNEVWLVDGQSKFRSTFVMKPDCRGYLQTSAGRFYVLLDAKHKVMRNDIAEAAGDLQAGHCIDRGDLYQMISYCKSLRPRREATDGVLVALIGLNYEAGNEHEIISTVPNVLIDDGGSGINVIRICINFGAVMKRLGQSLGNESSVTQCLSELGEGISKALIERNRDAKAV